MLRCVEGEDWRGLKFNASKSKVMVVNGEKGLECEVLVDGIRLEHVLEFKYWILDDQAQMWQNAVGKW